MNRHPNHSLRISASYLVASLLLTGCSSSEPEHPAALSTEALLEIIDLNKPRHDPAGYAELNLGLFRVTHETSIEDARIIVNCELVAIVPESKKEAVAAAATTHQKRMRDAVIAVLQKADEEQLSDPDLAQLKDTLRSQLTRAMETTHIRDIVFTMFSTDRGS